MQRNQDFAQFERAGIYLDAVEYVKPEWRSDFRLAMDAQPTLITTANSGIPAFLTTLVDPNLIRVLTAPNNAAKILGEVRKGAWTDVVAMFPVVEQTGEVSSYGDFNGNGRAGINTNFPQRESYLYQVILEYGDLEMDRAGLAKIGYAQEVKEAAVAIMNKFQNLTYFYGVSGLQNYGLLNDPSLAAPIAPAVKAAGGVKWMNGSVMNATANEVYADVQSLFGQLVTQTGGLVNQETKMVLAMSPKSQVALTATNQFGINVSDLLKKNFPNLRVETAIQYGALTAQNPQGVAAGEMVQLVAEEIEGQDTGFVAFNEKLRAGPVIRQLSSWQQKYVGGSWGAVLKMPMAVAGLLGV